MKTHGKEYANARRDNKIRREGGQPMSEWKKTIRIEIQKAWEELK